MQEKNNLSFREQSHGDEENILGSWGEIKESLRSFSLLIKGLGNYKVPLVGHNTCILSAFTCTHQCAYCFK